LVFGKASLHRNTTPAVIIIISNVTIDSFNNFCDNYVYFVLLKYLYIFQRSRTQLVDYCKLLFVLQFVTLSCVNEQANEYGIFEKILFTFNVVLQNCMV